MKFFVTVCHIVLHVTDFVLSGNAAIAKRLVLHPFKQNPPSRLKSFQCPHHEDGHSKVG